MLQDIFMQLLVCSRGKQLLRTGQLTAADSLLGRQYQLPFSLETQSLLLSEVKLVA